MSHNATVLPRLLLASANAKKLRELHETAASLGVAVLGPAQWQAEAEGRAVLPPVDEDGETFAANGLKKALSAVQHARAYGDPHVSVLADDSGLCVAALGGRPGVHSARWAAMAQGGHGNADDAANRRKVLADLDGQADRRAYFNCTLVLAGPLAEGGGCGRSDEGVAWRVFEGRCHGTLLECERGEGGFGYDPLFVSDELGQTFAEAPAHAKHAVSHRGRAMAQLAAYLQLRALTTGAERKPLYLRPLGLATVQAALERTLRKGLRYADQALEQALGDAPALGAKERQAVAALHWHGLRRLGHLHVAAAALRGGPPPQHAPDPRQLVAPQAAGLALLLLSDLDPWGEPRDPAKKQEATALDGLAERNPGLAARWPHPPGQYAVAARTAAYAARSLPEPDRTALQWGYHPQFVTALTSAWGARDAAAAMDYLNQRGPLTLRVNRLRSDRDRVAERLRGEGIETVAVPGLPDALWVVQAARITATAAYAEGALEIQDEGSQRIVAATGAAPGQLVIDWCAGAGGKTLALAAQMALGRPEGQGGRLIACDTHPERLAECQRRAARSGVAVEVRTLDRSSKAFGDLAGRADVVLVDAPCSSSGALRRNPELRWHLDAGWLGRFASQQLAILQRAAAHVRPGGRLVYATCSLMPAENEGVVAAFLQAETQFAQVADARVGPADRHWLATHPLAQFGPDGFYWCVLRRREPARRREAAPVAPPADAPV